MKKNLKSSLLILGISVLGLVAGQTEEATAAAEGFYTKEGKVLDANGNPFVFQGINYPQAWGGKYEGYAQMKAKGANSVRIVFNGGCAGTPASDSSISLAVQFAKNSKMVAVVENHDTTGYGEEGKNCSLEQAANYWVSVKDALIGQEKYVILNIGNEPWGNSGESGWIEATKNAIKIIRDAGIRNALMVDAPNWGQDHSRTMLNNAASIAESDPLKNVIFSVHMYAVYKNPETITSYIDDFVELKLPLVVGEFADFHQGEDLPYDVVTSYSKEKVSGYMGWSWSGNGGADKPLDMVNDFNPKRETKWGKRFFPTLADSKEASIFQSAP